MKEITRIHIAKVAYDIELGAKRELEQYNKQLELYVHDHDVMVDVEVRMTELLAERGVMSDGVITLDDVRGVRDKLGEPHEFAGDPEVSDSSPTQSGTMPRRRLYRDQDGAMLGGVLSGIAMFFGINPLWTRLLFLLALLASFGTVAIVYIVLWIVVPPARTAAEKLQSAGLPVTLANMKDLRDQAVDALAGSRTPQLVKNVLLYTTGTLACAGTVVALVMTAWMGLGLVFGTSDNSPLGNLVPDSWLSWVSYGLFVLSGLLLATLGAIVAYACFGRRVSRRTVIALITVIVAGIAAFSSGIGGITYDGWQKSSQMEALRQTSTVALPSSFEAVKRLSISAHSASNEHGEYNDFRVQYVVSPGAPRYVLEALPDTKPDIAVDVDQARIILKASAMQNDRYAHAAPRLTIYGPALDELTSEQGVVQYSGDQTRQQTLAVKTIPGSTIEVYGVFNVLNVTAGGTVDAAFSTVYTLSVDIATGGSVKSGVVKNLTVTQPEVCPAIAREDGGALNSVQVDGVTSGRISYNGTLMTAKTHQTSCGEVVIGDRIESDY